MTVIDEDHEEEQSLLGNDYENQKVFVTTKYHESPDASSPPAPAGRGALLCSFLTLLLSIPALIGAWCWPAIVVGIVGGTATASARSLSHHLSFGLTAFMMLAITVFIAYESRKRNSRVESKYGPTIMCVFAALLVMADPTRHLLQDVKVWPAPSSSEYRPGCPTESIACLSVVGWLFTITFTYLGFFFLAWATMWNAHILMHLKHIGEKWRELRHSYKSEGEQQQQTDRPDEEEEIITNNAHSRRQQTGDNAV